MVATKLLTTTARRRKRVPTLYESRPLLCPCFIDAFYPEVGIATLELLERFGIEVDYPQEQTCCGQPMANSGAHADAAGAERVFARNFVDYDYIVGPSASCIHHVREHLSAIEQTDEVRKVRAGAYELVEFLHDVVGAREFPWAEFPYRVGLHNSCSALRHLKEASVSEVAGQPFSKPRTLLEGVKGIEFVKPSRPDECCGFGGTFSVTEEACLGAHGVGQGARSSERRRAIHRIGRHVVSDASARLRRAHEGRRALHPHRSGAERGTRMSRIDHAEGSRRVHQED